jgi:hypothetical protein
MDLEKIVDASHQAWFVAMAKQGWIFGPILNPDRKTHPWLKPYAGLSDAAKEIVRAQVRGTLQALEGQGGLPAPGAPSSSSSDAVASRTVPKAVPTPVSPMLESSASASEVIERKIDASGRMRIGAGLVKKAELIVDAVNQVGIRQLDDALEVVPHSVAGPNAFLASVNPDGFMLPKAMLSGMGASEFILTLTPGRLEVKPK